MKMVFAKVVVVLQRKARQDRAQRMRQLGATARRHVGMEMALAVAAAAVVVMLLLLQQMRGAMMMMMVNW